MQRFRDIQNNVPWTLKAIPKHLFPQSILIRDNIIEGTTYKFK